MTYITKNLKQTATYWGTPAKNGYGGHTFATPTTIDCRWEERTEVFLDEQGKEQKSTAVVYVGEDLDVDGWLYLGTSTESDPSDVDGAYPIKVFRKVPNIKGTKFEGRAIL